MIVAHCPRCAEAIRVPSTQLPDDAYAQCPLCRESFAATELLDRLPPVVQLMGADGSPLEFLDAAPQSLVDHTGFSAQLMADDHDSELESDQESNPFTDAAGSVGNAAGAVGNAAGAMMSTGGMAAAAVVAGGAAALGLASGADEAHIEELDEIEELLEDDDDGGVLLSDQYQDDATIESEVEGFLEEVGHESETHEDADSSESTLLMDTMENDEGEFNSAAVSTDDEVDVEDEVQQFLGAETIEFESDGLDHDSELDSEATDLVIEEVALDSDEVSFESDGDVDELVTSDPVAAVAPMKVRSRPAARKKKASSWKTMAGVALGPLLALPLAGGILLAFGKAPDLGFWPFDGKGDSKSNRVAYNPNESSPNPTTVRSDTFGQSSGLVPDDSELGEFVRDNEDMANDDIANEDIAGEDEDIAGGDSLPAGTSDGELKAPNFSAGLDTNATNEPAADSTGDNPAFAFPDSGSTNEPAADSSAPEMIDPLAGSDITSNDPDSGTDSDVAIQMPGTNELAAPNELSAPKGAPDSDLELPEMSATDPALTDPRKQAESRTSLDTVFGIPEKSTASASKVAVDAKPKSTASSDSIGNLDQPAMLRGLPRASDDSGSPFGDGVSLDGPAVTDSPELTEATEKATQAIVALLTKRAEGSATRKDMARTYATVCRVGAFPSSSRSTSLRNLLQEIGQSTLIEDFGGDTVVQWLRYSKRPTPGIIMVGTVGGDANSATINLTDGNSVAVSMSDASPLPPVGQKVIGIGEITGENQVKLNAAFPVQ
ncbi:MAG: hypothetical protein WBD20_08130 [Pirellulaceae bacterium]